MKQIFDYLNEEDMKYQPENPADCDHMLCSKCVFDRYRTMGKLCPFRLWITDYPVEEPTDTDKSSNALQNQRSAQDILNMCMSLQANSQQMQMQPLENTVKAIDLLAKINQNVIKSIELQQEPDNPKMVFKMEEQPDEGSVGSLDTLSYVCVGRKNLTSREYYHHCPKQRGRLIRLEYSYERQEEFCPVCDQAFVSK